jgi:hypothetical protein
MRLLVLVGLMLVCGVDHISQQLRRAIQRWCLRHDVNRTFQTTDPRAVGGVHAGPAGPHCHQQHCLPQRLHHEEFRSTRRVICTLNEFAQAQQSRVCSTIAVAIVTEMCGPFTHIPAILDEYRTAELNVRTGCLKALSFVFEYVGPQSAYYCDSVVTTLDVALINRDLVH